MFFFLLFFSIFVISALLISEYKIEQFELGSLPDWGMLIVAIFALGTYRKRKKEQAFTAFNDLVSKAMTTYAKTAIFHNTLIEYIKSDTGYASYARDYTLQNEETDSIKKSISTLEAEWFFLRSMSYVYNNLSPTRKEPLELVLEAFQEYTLSVREMLQKENLDNAYFYSQDMMFKEDYGLKKLDSKIYEFRIIVSENYKMNNIH